MTGALVLLLIIVFMNFFFFDIQEDVGVFDILAIVNDADGHQVTVRQVSKEFRCHKEILAFAWLAGDVDKHLEDFAFVFRIHSLINFVDAVK